MAVLSLCADSDADLGFAAVRGAQDPVPRCACAAEGASALASNMPATIEFRSQIHPCLLVPEAQLGTECVDTNRVWW